MGEVKRYDFECYQSNISGEWETYARMKASDSGDYVLYSNYEKLKAQLEKAENTLKFYTEERSYKRSFDDDLGHVLLSEFLTQDWAPIVKDCGTMAREYFKEKEQV